jgi:trehalose/maltose transport system permease protein
MNKKTRQTISRVLFYILVVIILIYTIFPFYWAFVSSVTPSSQLSSTDIRFFPANPTIEHYIAVAENQDFLIALWNSTLVSFSVTALALLVGSLGAYALGRFRFKGRSPVLYTVLAMTMFPQIAVLGALFQMVNTFGLYNNLLALILTYMLFTLPFTVWVLTNFFKALPRDLEEAAYVDGASPFQTFWMVLLPLAAPGMVTTGLLAFIAAWNEYLFALSFMQTPQNYTVTIAITRFQGITASAFETPWGPIMAATVVVTIPLIVLTLIFQRRIIAGLTAGAVKG